MFISSTAFTPKNDFRKFILGPIKRRKIQFVIDARSGILAERSD